MTTQQRIERIECPWPESVWRMTVDQYVAAIPDEVMRTSISGFLMREGWKVAMGQVRDELAALTAFAEDQEKECRQKLIVDPDDKRSLLELVIQERNLTEDLADQLDRANIAHHELTGRYLRVQDQNVELQRQLETLRDAARAAIKPLIDAMYRYVMDVDEEPTIEHQVIVRSAEKLIEKLQPGIRCDRCGDLAVVNVGTFNFCKKHQPSTRREA